MAGSTARRIVLLVCVLTLLVLTPPTAQASPITSGGDPAAVPCPTCAQSGQPGSPVVFAPNVGECNSNLKHDLYGCLAVGVGTFFYGAITTTPLGGLAEAATAFSGCLGIIILKYFICRIFAEFPDVGGVPWFDPTSAVLMRGDDASVLRAGRFVADSDGGQFLTGQGGVTQANFFIAPGSNFISSSTFNEIPWTPLGPGTFDPQANFWTRPFNTSQLDGPYVLRVDFVDSTNPDGVTQGYSLVFVTAIPEPTSLALFGFMATGLVGCYWHNGRHAKARAHG